MKLLRDLMVAALYLNSLSLLRAQDPLFHAPFEDSLTAKTAAGSPDPHEKAGELKFEKGAFGNALNVGATNSFLAYPAEKNVNGDEGAVSLRLQPAWKPNDGKFHLFWTFLGNGVFNLYKYGGNDNQLIFLVTGRGESRDHYVTISTSIAQWEPGQPHHLAATWAPGVIQLFVDGEKVADRSDPKLPLPEAGPGSVFFIGDYYHPGYGAQGGLSGQADTLIRDFRIYGRALTDRQIADLAGVKKKATEPSPRPATAPPLVVVPRAHASPKIDGDFSLDEWRDAAAFTGFIDLASGGLTDLQTTVLLTYDAEKLYLALFALLPPGYELRTTADTRDGQVWNDDSIEVLLDPTRARLAGRGFHFIGNSRGVFYDDQDNRVAWNGAWEYQSRIQENWRGVGLRCWTVELAIPFAELGRKTPADGERWTANFAHTWFNGPQTFTAWVGPPEPRYNAPEFFGTLEFRERAPILQWTGLRDVSSGQPALEGFWRSEQTGHFNVGVDRTFALPASPRTPERWTGDLDLTGRPKGLLAVRVTASGTTNSLYEAQLPYALDLTPLRVFLSPVPTREQLVVDIDPVQYRKAWKPGWTLALDLQDSSGKSVSRQTIADYQPPFAHATLVTSSLAPGKYQLAVALRDARGKIVATERTPYEKRPRPAWVGNRIGVTDQVLKPWTPIVVGKSEMALSVWGRAYAYDHSLFPSQISSLKSELLAAPIQLVGIPKAAVAFKVTGQKPSTVDFTTRAGKTSVNNRFEYDGMLWCEVTLSAGRVESLALEIPLRAAVSTLYHPSNADWAVAGSEPGATPPKWNSSWKQCVWLGNENVGLAWFAESDQFWSLADPKHALEIERRDQATVLRVNLVTQPKTYASPPTFRFGLQATPMRPPLKGWRGWQFASHAGYHPDPNNPEHVTHAVSWWMNWSPRIASPFEWTPNMKRLVASYHRFGIRVIPYQALLALNENAPDAPDWRAEWLIKPRIEAGGEQGQRCLYVNVKGSFADYFLYGIREEVRAAGWDGMYFDFCQGALPDANELHGSGYVDDEGKRRPTYDLLAQREFFKRLMAMFQNELGVDEPIIMVHLSANKIPPIHAFCNVYFDGEQHAYVPKVDDDYTKILSLDTFRCEFLGRQFGGVPVLLPELNLLQIADVYAKDPAAKPKAHARWLAATDTMLIYPLLHGTLFSPSWLDPDYLAPLRNARAEFGMADARFIGYWENHPAIHLAPTTDQVKASVYAKDHRLWLVVGNLGDETAKANVRLDLRSLSPKLDPRAMQLKNIFGQGALATASNEIQLEVPRKSLRIIELK